MKHLTISLDALRAVLSERVRDAGGPTAFAAQVGLTPAAWGNMIHSETRKPGPEMLALLGYVEDPPRYRLARKGRKG